MSLCIEQDRIRTGFYRIFTATSLNLHFYLVKDFFPLYSISHLLNGSYVKAINKYYIYFLGLLGWLISRFLIYNYISDLPFRFISYVTMHCLPAKKMEQATVHRWHFLNSSGNHSADSLQPLLIFLCHQSCSNFYLPCGKTFYIQNLDLKQGH